MKKLFALFSILFLTSTSTAVFADVTYDQIATFHSTTVGCCGSPFGDSYGINVTAADDYMFVSAPNATISDNKDAEGAVYVYKKTHHGWINTQIIVTDGTSDHFGATRIVKKKNWLFISAIGTPIGPIPNDVLSNQNFSGSVQIYHLNHSTGQFDFATSLDNTVPGLENLSFVDPTGVNPPQLKEQGAGFGLSFDVNEDEKIILVGAATQANIDQNLNVLINVGTVFSLKYDHNFNFTLLQSFTNPDGLATNDGFGGVVKIHNDYALISNSAIFSEQHLNNSSSVYLYQLIENNWTYLQKVQGDQVGGTTLNSPLVYGGPVTIADNFGSFIAFDGEWALIGAPYENLGTNTLKGAAYFFKLEDIGGNSKRLVFKQKVVSSDPNALITGFGVALNGKLAAVADPLRTGPAGPGQGAALAYHYEHGEWVNEAALFDETGVSYEIFGVGLDIIKNTIYVGTGASVPSLVLVIFYSPPLDPALPLPVVQPGTAAIFQRHSCD